MDARKQENKVDDETSKTLTCPRLLSLRRSEGVPVSSLQEGKEKKERCSHWDVYARDVTAVTVRASGSTITLDLPP